MLEFCDDVDRRSPSHHLRLCHSVPLPSSGQSWEMLSYCTITYNLALLSSFLLIPEFYTGVSQAQRCGSGQSDHHLRSSHARWLGKEQISFPNILCSVHVVTDVCYQCEHDVEILKVVTGIPLYKPATNNKKSEPTEIRGEDFYLGQTVTETFTPNQGMGIFVKSANMRAL